MAFIDSIKFDIVTVRKTIVCTSLILLCFSLQSFCAETIGYVWPKKDLLVPDSSKGGIKPLQGLQVCPLVKKIDVGWVILWESTDGSPRLALIPFHDVLGNPTVDLYNKAYTSGGTFGPYGPSYGGSFNPLITLRSTTGVTPKPAYIPLNAGERYPVISEGNGSYLAVYIYSVSTYAFTQTVAVAKGDCSYVSVADYATVIENLISNVETAIAAGGSAEYVAATFTNYNGRLADETAEERRKLAKQYADKATLARQQRAEAAKRQQFEAEQTARGLVNYQGEWIPKFDAEQRAKGLIRFHDEWITPEERKSRLAEETRVFEAAQM